MRAVASRTAERFWRDRGGDGRKWYRRTRMKSDLQWGIVCDDKSVANTNFFIWYRVATDYKRYFCHWPLQRIKTRWSEDRENFIYWNGKFSVKGPGLHETNSGQLNICTQICTVAKNCKWLLNLLEIVCTFLFFTWCTPCVLLLLNENKRKSFALDENKIRFILEAKYNKPQNNLRSKIDEYCFLYFSFVSLPTDVYFFWVIFLPAARESSRKLGARSNPSPIPLRFSVRI